MNNIADKDKLIIVCYVVLPSKHTKIEAVNPILISSEDLKKQFTDIISKLNENLKHLKLK